MAKSGYGVIMPEKEGAKIASGWRENNQAVANKDTGIWAKYEDAFKASIGDRRVTEVGPIRFAMRGAYNLIALPSKRCLHYMKPRLVPNGVQFMGTNMGTWALVDTYGGKLTENICQAVSRDVIAEGILRAEEMGFKVFMTVHDEVVSLVPEDSELTEKELCEALTVVPEWATGLPLNAEGYTAKRYRK